MYSAVVLDEKSHLKLVSWAYKNIKVTTVRLPILVEQNKWEIKCHHMLIEFNGIPDYIVQYLGTKQSLDVTHIGVTPLVVAVKVSGFPSLSRHPHITVAVNSPAGAESKMSNNIMDWTPIDNGPTLTGIVQKLN